MILGMEILVTNPNFSYPRQDDFSYAYYGQLIDEMRVKHPLHTFSEAASVLESAADSSNLQMSLMRHDVDVDPDPAFMMAKLERDSGIQSTYFVIPNTPLYDIEDPTVIARIREIGRWHEIGLHYYPDYGEDVGQMCDLEERIHNTALRLSDVLELPIESVSFHKPGNRKAFLYGPLRLGRLVNAYADVFMQEYATDSKGAWRFGDPIQRVRQSTASIVQVLVHPLWWNADYKSPANTLDTYRTILGESAAHLLELPTLAG